MADNSAYDAGFDPDPDDPRHADLLDGLDDPDASAEAPPRGDMMVEAEEEPVAPAAKETPRGPPQPPETARGRAVARNKPVVGDPNGPIYFCNEGPGLNFALHTKCEEQGGYGTSDHNTAGGTCCPKCARDLVEAKDGGPAPVIVEKPGKDPEKTFPDCGVCGGHVGPTVKAWGCTVWACPTATCGFYLCGHCRDLCDYLSREAHALAGQAAGAV